MSLLEKIRTLKVKGIEELLEVLLDKIGALKAETLEGKIIGYGTLECLAIEAITQDEYLPKLKTGQKFVYLIEKPDKSVVGVYLNIKNAGQYPGNGSEARFEVRTGWLVGNALVTSKEMVVPRDNKFEKEKVDFYKGTIHPKFIKPY